MKLGNRELRVAAIVATAFIGCAGGSESGSNEKLGEVSQEWGTAGCADAPFNALVQGFIDPPITTTATYNTCKKSYVVDIVSYGWVSSGGGTSGAPVDGGVGSGGTGGTGGAPVDGGVGSSGAPNVTVRWAHTLPTNETACTTSFVGGIFYRKDESGVWQNVGNGQNLSHGVWANGLCSFAPAVYQPLELGRGYRIAATARDPANNTVPLTIQTGDPGLP